MTIRVVKKIEGDVIDGVNGLVQPETPLKQGIETLKLQLKLKGIDV